MATTPNFHNETLRRPNGSGAAAILAAGIGAGVLGILALASDAIPAVNHVFQFAPASGDLSGVTTTSVIIWLLVWFGLSRHWRGRDVNLLPINLAALALLAAGLLLTFPPFMDLLEGK
ncbi:MAG: hypothetical protein P4L66_07915 [Acetobacteraceae bacterium]|nr:hypothetical protein [Acetobacteraceae bacterium]